MASKTHKGPSWTELANASRSSRTIVEFEGVGDNKSLQLKISSVADFRSYSAFIVNAVDTSGNKVTLLGSGQHQPEEPCTYEVI